MAARPQASGAAQKYLAEHGADQDAFLKQTLQPALRAAVKGKGHVFFVDAAHFVHASFRCCWRSFLPVCVRAASGRQRFNVLGAWDAVGRRLVSVTNTTVVNQETRCEMLRKIAALGLKGPVRLALDNAKYQRAKAVRALAKKLGLTLVFLPSYSPNLNLIERLWKFTKRQALYGRHHPDFASFRSAIETTLAELSDPHAEKLKTLMTHNFQRFENVALMTA